MTAYAITDSATMLRRSLRRMRRYPSLFVYVFGGTLGAGLGGPAVAALGRDAYLAYVVPGILLLTVVGAGTGTAISVAMDMTAGIIARFRTMAIARGSVLTGHILGSVIQIFLALGLVLVVAVAIGYRPAGSPAQWLAAAALLGLTSVAVCTLSVGFGLATDSVETASNTPMILTLLLFLSSAFVPVESMPDPLRWFAERQPFTPITETLRGLLAGTPVIEDAPVAVAWCVVISVVGYLWARRLYERVPVRPGA
jgi:ABC-2 type transport system permease protein